MNEIMQLTNLERAIKVKSFDKQSTAFDESNFLF